MMQLLGTSPQILFDRVYPFEVRYLTYQLRWAHMLAQKPEQGGHMNLATEFAGPPNEWLGPFPHNNAELWNGQELWPRCFAAAWKEFSRGDRSNSHQRSDGQGAALLRRENPLLGADFSSAGNSLQLDSAGA